MCTSDAERCGSPWEESALQGEESRDQSEHGDDSCRSPCRPAPDDVWDAFELDEETAEPQPEHGDFWGELDEDEAV